MLYALGLPRFGAADVNRGHDILSLSQNYSINSWQNTGIIQ